MGKKRTSVSVDEDVYRYLQRDDVNASGLVNQLVRNYMIGPDDGLMMLRLREEQLRSEREELQDRLENRSQELQRIEERIGAVTADREEILNDAEDTFTPSMLDPENPAVEIWADRLGVTPEEFIERMEERLQ